MPTGEALRRQVWSAGRDNQRCSHHGQIRDVLPVSEGCAKCLAMGDTWIHLRLCMTCGHVGCCDNSKNKHASKHFAETEHPIMKSMQPDEDWMWCFVDQLTFKR